MTQKSQLFKWIFAWTGPALILIGLTSGVLSGQWGLLPLVFLFLGLFVILVQILMIVTQPMFWRARSTQTNTNGFIATLAMVMILTLVNGAATEFGFRIDFTENQRYTLAPQSQQVVQQLAAPVKLVIFDNNENQSITTLNTLDNYQRLSGGNLTYEFIDPRSRPVLVQEFGVQAPGEVYLQAGETKQLIQNLQQEPLSESRLTNALARLAQDNQDTVYFLQGHGEYDFSQISTAIQRLEERSYFSEPLNLAERLAQGEAAIPDDASVVVVANPQQALFEPEIEALQTYLDGGGSLLVLVEPYQEPGLEPLLVDWGVTLDDKLVIDGTGGMVAIDAATGGLVGYGPVAPLITRYGDHPITIDFGNNNSFYPLARAVLVENREGILANELLITNDQSWAESDVENRPGFDQGEDLPGPLTLGVALSRPSSLPGLDPGLDLGEATEANPSQPEQSEPRLVVIGSSQFFTNGLFSQQLNGDMFSNAVIWLSQRDGEVLSISPKDPTNRRIEMSGGQRNLLYWMALAILPLFGFALAFFIWLQKR